VALNIVVLCLILAITFMHSIFGLYSGVIHVCCCILAALVAFGFFEPLTLLLTREAGLHPAYTEPCCLLLLFVVTLIVLRSAADNLLRGNVQLPQYLDTGGAIVLGFIGAEIVVGVLVISVLMLPLGGRVMGFSRFERDPESRDENNLARFERNSVWLMPDEFTVGLVRQISGGSLRATTPLAAVYPSFTEWVFYSGNTVQWESSPGVHRDRSDGTTGLRVEKWWEQTDPIVGRYRKDVPDKTNKNPPYAEHTYRPPAGTKLVGARLKLLPSSADRERTRSLHLFRPTMIRLVGDEHGSPRHAIPRVIAGADKNLGDKPRIVDIDNNFSLDAGGEVAIDVYFEVGEDFIPRFVEYRRRARAAISESERLKKAPGALAAPAAAAAGGPGGSEQEARGAMRFIDFVEGSSGDNPRLPLRFAAGKLRSAGAEVAGKQLKSGRIMGERSTLEHIESGDTAVEQFAVPEEWRLCQIRYRPKKALTVAGQVFNYVARTVNQYYAVDSSGDKHLLCGYYAIVKRGGNAYIELFYTGEPDSAGYRGMLDFKEIKASELTGSDDAELGLLFFIPPGRSVLGIENQAGQGVSGLNFQMGE
jgi:hypothetical protein